MAYLRLQTAVYRVLWLDPVEKRNMACVLYPLSPIFLAAVYSVPGPC